MVANATHPIRAANGSGCARHAKAIDALDADANSTDCRPVGQRAAHNIAPATPPRKATPVIAIGTGPRGPSALTTSATKLSAIEAEIPAIIARVAPPMPRACAGNH
jgi:hypothetical protein